MKNLKITAYLVNNSLIDFFDEMSGERFIQHLIGDDTGAPVNSLSITAKTEDDEEIYISIPNDNSDDVYIEIKDKNNEVIYAPKEYTVRSTSLNSAECDEIILRETNSTRLVFKPMLVNNIKNKNASVKGDFVFQKKSKTGKWEDSKSLNLSNLKATEWIKLELKSAELLKFFNELSALYRTKSDNGIQYGKIQYIKATGDLKELAALNSNDIKNIFELNKNAGFEVFSKLLNYISKTGFNEEVIEKLEELDIKSIDQINGIIGLTNLKRNYEIWLKNTNNADEEFWQKLFSENSFILSQIFSTPVVIVKDKAYVGGKTIGNKEGNLLDFLLKNELTENAILIEIKTPETKLLGNIYRNNYNISNDLSGSIIQLSNYKHSLLKSYTNLIQNEKTFESFNPKCVLIIGNISNELDSVKKKNSFELFRNSITEMQIITYDELFSKINFFINLLEGKVN